MHEILFQNSVITIKTLNILLAIGFVFAGVFSIRYVEKHKMNLGFLTRSMIPLILSALFFGRLLYGLENYNLFQVNPMALLYIWDLNFSFFGMLFGGLIMLHYLTRKNDEDFWAWVDVVSLSCLSILIFVHLGYFFSGQNYGAPTSLPWGITFDVSHIPYLSPLHPIQLYAFLLCIVLLAYSVDRSKRIHLSGVVGTRALMIYSLCMLGIDFLRGDPSLYYYQKIAYGLLAALSFIASIHCSHKSHTAKQIN